MLLWRGVENVAIAGGMLSVMSTGVFQPASITPTHNSADFNLWQNMMREYSEEFLGNAEHDRRELRYWQREKSPPTEANCISSERRLNACVLTPSGCKHMWTELTNIRQ